MVRGRTKKAKGDEAFTTKKQKVGRKKLEPATATRAEVHSANLRITVAKELTDAQEKLKHDADRGSQQTFDKTDDALKLSDCLSLAGHYKPATRAQAFEKAWHWLCQNDCGRNSPAQTSILLRKALDSLIDVDERVRSFVVKIVDAIDAQCYGREGTNRRPIALLVLRRLNIGLTHAVAGVRKDALTILQSALQRSLNVPSLPLHAKSFLHLVAEEDSQHVDEVDALLVSVTVAAKASDSWEALVLTLRTLVPPVSASALASVGTDGEDCNVPTASFYARWKRPQLPALFNEVWEHSATLLKERFEMNHDLFRNHSKLQSASGMCRTLGILLDQPSADASSEEEDSANTTTLAESALPAKAMNRMRQIVVGDVSLTADELFLKSNSTRQLGFALAALYLPLLGNKERKTLGAVLPHLLACCSFALRVPSKGGDEIDEGGKFLLPTHAARLEGVRIAQRLVLAARTANVYSESLGRVVRSAINVTLHLAQSFDAYSADAASTLELLVACVELMEIALYTEKVRVYEKGALLKDLLACVPKVLFFLRPQQRAPNDSDDEDAGFQAPERVLSRVMAVEMERLVSRCLRLVHNAMTSPDLEDITPDLIESAAKSIPAVFGMKNKSGDVVPGCLSLCEREETIQLAINTTFYASLSLLQETGNQQKLLEGLPIGRCVSDKRWAGDLAMAQQALTFA